MSHTRGLHCHQEMLYFREHIQTLLLLDWNFIDRGTLQTPDEGSHSSINPRDVKLIYNQMMVVISGLMIPA